MVPLKTQNKCSSNEFNRIQKTSTMIQHLSNRCTLDSTIM
jgi:hypothetical protein